MDIVVLGGGVVGVTSAWYLAKAGHKVTLLERRGGVALETSHANGFAGIPSDFHCTTAAAKLSWRASSAKSKSRSNFASVAKTRRLSSR